MEKFKKSKTSTVYTLNQGTQFVVCESYNKEFLLKVPVVSWADHMEYTDEIGKNERLELYTHAN